MKNLTLALILILSILAGGFLDGQDHGLLPAPKKAVWGKDKFRLAGAKIHVSAELLAREEKAIARFAQSVNQITGRFDSEYLLWRNRYSKITDYNNHKDEKAQVAKFEKLFINTK
jgi:hypothetical protein